MMMMLVQLIAAVKKLDLVSMKILTVMITMLALLITVVLKLDVAILMFFVKKNLV
jgi:hypothetical protein